MSGQTKQQERAMQNGHALSGRAVWSAFIGLGALFLITCGALIAISEPLFGYSVLVIDMPVLTFVSVYSVLGLAFVALTWLVWRTAGTRADTRTLLWVTLGAGLVFRLLLIPTEPILEDDYQRYLWDGGVTAEGLNPYAVAPEDVSAGQAPVAFLPLAEEAGVTLERVNHPELRTIYPAVAQGAFALAHVIAPYELWAWKALCVVGDMASLGFLLLLLAAMGRSPLWSLLFWWNPLILKEHVNSAHMEALLVPFVLAAVWHAAKARPAVASIALGLAAGVKIWPVLLAPLVWRQLWGHWLRLVGCAALLGVLCILWALPVFFGGLDETSGFVAYAERWQTNSALLPMLIATIEHALAPVGAAAAFVDAGTLARGLCAAIVAALALWVARRPTESVSDLVGRAALVTGVLFLLSPAQFPWYAAWVIAFLPLLPRWGFIALAVTMPLYYVGFHHLARDTYDVQRTVIVWLVWIPIWGLLLAEWAMNATDTKRDNRQPVSTAAT